MLVSEKNPPNDYAAFVDSPTEGVTSFRSANPSQGDGQQWIGQALAIGRQPLWIHRFARYKLPSSFGFGGAHSMQFLATRIRNQAFQHGGQPVARHILQKLDRLFWIRTRPAADVDVHGIHDPAVDLRPFQPRPHSGTYCALRLNPDRAEQFFTLYHPDYRVLIGYIFPAANTPWLADWQENQSSTVLPWNGQVVARGIEFGTSPFAEGLRKSVERGSLLGAPAYRWIGARQRLGMEFTLFLTEISQGFAGVKDARTEHGVPILTPR